MEAQGEKKTNVPGYELLKELFEARPTALIFDEYQTWFDGLTDSRVQKSSAFKVTVSFVAGGRNPHGEWRSASGKN